MDLFEKNEEFNNGNDDSDSDDEDFVPNANELEASDLEDEDVLKSNGKKRKTKKRGDVSGSDEDDECTTSDKNEKVENGKGQGLTEEEEKQRTEKLYNEFLLGVNKSNGSTCAKPNDRGNGVHDESGGSSCSSSVSLNGDDSSALNKSNSGMPTPGSAKLLGSRPVPVGRISILSNSPAQIGLLSKPGVKRPGGLSAVLSAIQSNKKQKLGTLEKSRLDWQAFKKDEGIEEELRTQVKGKDSFVERQQFLQRTDLRQFEIEKNIRSAQRKPL